jgi:hypothetical protein
MASPLGANSRTPGCCVSHPCYLAKPALVLSTFPEHFSHSALLCTPPTLKRFSCLSAFVPDITFMWNAIPYQHKRSPSSFGSQHLPNWVSWLMSVVPATQEAEAEGWLEPRSLGSVWATQWNPSSRVDSELPEDSLPRSVMLLYTKKECYILEECTQSKNIAF